jgi:hypothetical protein
LNPSGSTLVYSTFLGGSGNDQGYGITVDNSGDVYCTGYTDSADFPTTPGAFQTAPIGTAFVTELNPTAQGLLYSTFLGGGDETGFSITQDSLGDLLVAGSTASAGFPVTPGALQTGFGGMWDVFVSKFEAGDQVWPLTLNFGNQTIGVSNSQTTILSNSGTTDLTITELSVVGANSSDFSQTNTCGNSLPPGATCAITVTLTASIAGFENATLSIIDTAANSPQTVALSGTGILPVVTLSPPSLNFGSQLLGVTSPPQTVTLSTNGPTTITSIKASAQFSETNNCGSSLGAGASCTINVTFTPTALGLQNGTLTVTDGAAGSPQTASLSGSGVQPTVTLSPNSLTFPTQVVFTASKAQTVGLTNTGTGTLTIASIAATGQFTETNTCGTSVAPGASCIITVTFTPQTIGTLTGSVTITDNGPGSPQMLSLSGCGTYLQFSSASVGFGNQPVGTTSLPRKLIVSNKGSTAVSITSISITGTDPADFAETNTCGGSIAAGASCTVNVTFTPAAQGSRTADLSFNDNGGCSPQTVTLSGTGTGSGVNNPAPVIFQPLVPAVVAPGGGGFTLTVNGDGFVSGSVVDWNGSTRPTTFISSRQVQATITSSDIAVAGTALVTVSNPTPGGGSSNSVYFSITSSASSLVFGRTDVAVGTAPKEVFIADYDGDGKLDLAATNSGSNTVSILLGNGDGTFQTHVDYAVGTSPRSLAAGDFNGDGKLDIAVSNNLAGTISLLIGNGDGTFKTHVDYPAGNSPGAIVVADLNQDGKLDLVVTNFKDNVISVFLGNGDGTFGPRSTYATGIGPAVLTLGDFNQDGKLDVSTGDFTANTISVLLGNGDGTFGAHTEYAAGSAPSGIVPADFNADGKLDLAVSNQKSVLRRNLAKTAF